MKNFIVILAFIMAINIVNAQENNSEVRTIFGSKGNHSNGGYGAVMINYGQVNNHDALFMGARGAWLIDHNFGIGLGGYGFVSDPKLDPVINEEYQFSGGYGGLLIEPVVAAKFPVHVSFPILIGAGGVAYNKHWQETDNDNYCDETYEDSDAFFILEPGIELEFNMVKFFRLGLSVTYRYTSDINLGYKETTINAPMPNVIGSQGMLRGFNYGIVFKFGKF